MVSWKGTQIWFRVLDASNAFCTSDLEICEGEQALSKQTAKPPSHNFFMLRFLWVADGKRRQMIAEHGKDNGKFAERQDKK